MPVAPLDPTLETPESPVTPEPVEEPPSIDSPDEAPGREPAQPVEAPGEEPAPGEDSLEEDEPGVGS